MVDPDAWRILGASARGLSHVQSGVPCQDSHGWFAQGDLVCLAVADGAGSRPRSAEGSAWAVRSVLSQVESLMDGSADTTVVNLFQGAHADLKTLAAAELVEPDTFDTTLAVVLIGNGSVVVGQVGDSICAIHEGESVVGATPEPPREYANETNFVTRNDWADVLRIDTYEASDVAAVALSTDGLRYKILDAPSDGTIYVPFFEDLFEFARSPCASNASIADFIAGISDQSGDDKSLVVAVRATTDTSEFVINGCIKDSAINDGQALEAPGSRSQASASDQSTESRDGIS